MTIRTGDAYTVRTLSEFRRYLDAEWNELARALPSGLKVEIMGIENDLRADEDKPPVNSIVHIEDEMLSEHLNAQKPPLRPLILTVLDERDVEYTYVHDSGVHRIIALDPVERGHR